MIYFALPIAFLFQATASDPNIGSDNPFDKFDSREAVQPWGNLTPEYAWQGDFGFAWAFEKDVSIGNNVIGAWVRWQFRVPEPNQNFKMLTRYSFDCADKYRVDAQTTYDSDGRVLSAVEIPTDWMFVRPDSPIAAYSEAFCART